MRKFFPHLAYVLALSGIAGAVLFVSFGLIFGGLTSDRAPSPFERWCVEMATKPFMFVARVGLAIGLSAWPMLIVSSLLCGLATYLTLLGCGRGARWALSRRPGRGKTPVSTTVNPAAGNATLLIIAISVTLWVCFLGGFAWFWLREAMPAPVQFSANEARQRLARVLQVVELDLPEKLEVAKGVSVPGRDRTEFWKIHGTAEQLHAFHQRILSRFQSDSNFAITEADQLNALPFGLGDSENATRRKLPKWWTPWTLSDLKIIDARTRPFGWGFVFCFSFEDGVVLISFWDS